MSESVSPWEQPKGVSGPTRWGNLTLLRQGRAELWLPGPNNEPYLADTAGGPITMYLRCDCGYEFSVEKSKFPGRRIARNCNRPECPYAEAAREGKSAAPRLRGPGRPPVAIPGCVATVYLRGKAARGIIAYANRRGLSFSRAVSELATLGLESVTENGEPEAPQEPENGS